MEIHAVAGRVDLVFLSGHFLVNAVTGPPSGEGSYGGDFLAVVVTLRLDHWLGCGFAWVVFNPVFYDS